MHAQKYEVLRRADPAFQAKLQAAAVRYKVTVDDVVRAGLGRMGVSGDARDAAERLERETPGAFAPLADWPEHCRFCLDLLRAVAPATCAFCSAIGCGECVQGEGCPACQATAREARERAVEHQRAQERTERLKLARALPRPATPVRGAA